MIQVILLQLLMLLAPILIAALLIAGHFTSASNAGWGCLFGAVGASIGAIAALALCHVLYSMEPPLPQNVGRCGMPAMGTVAVGFLGGMSIGIIAGLCSILRRKN